MHQNRKSSRLQFETLEARTLMASDFKIALYLETLDMNNNPVSRVEVGENFKLRMSVEELNPVLKVDLGVGGYSGIRFNAKLADKNGDVKFAEGYSIAQGFDLKAPGEWEDVGAHPNLFSSVFAVPPKRHVQWEVPMKAKSGGEIVFESNPSDRAGVILNSVYYNPMFVKFGYARLQIGDPKQFPASPWRNPGDPSDVDGNGVTNEDDLKLLETVLGLRQPEVPYQSPEPRGGIETGSASAGGLSAEVKALVAVGAKGSIQLDGSSVPMNKAPFLDVDGDRIADASDVAAMREKFPEPPTADPFGQFLAFLFKPTYKLDLSVVNVRTGLEVKANTEVIQGDLLEVKMLEMLGDRAEVVSSDLSQLLPDRHFKFIEGRTNLLVAAAPGNLKIEFAPTSDPFGRKAMLAGVTPQALDARLQELLKPLSRTIVVKESSKRPQAKDESYPYAQLVGLQSARDVAALLAKPDALVLSIDANHGVLKNQDSETLRGVVVTNPSLGHFTFNEDGSFKYEVYGHPYNNSLYDFIKEGDEFSYVLMSEDGTSDIRKVQIQGIALPLVDLSLTVVDANGKKLSSIAVGQEVYLEIAAYGNNIYRSVPPQFPSAHPLHFDYQVNANVGRSIGAPVISDKFNWERLSLGQENGKLVLKSENVGPRVFEVESETKAIFDRYRLTSQQQVLLRQKFVATQPGPLDLSISDAFLNLPNVDAAAVRVVVDSVQVTQAASVENRFDVSGNGEVSPLDALLIINRINVLRASRVSGETASATDVFDVNRDGIVAPLDALLVINWLSVQRKLMPPAEGEFALSRNAVAAVDLAIFDATEDFAVRRRQRR